MKIGVIGTSWITEKFLQAARLCGSFSVTAVYSRKMETGQAFASKNDISEVYDSLEAMLQSPNVDIVYISSPNGMHYAQAKQALQGGRHVIVEKPAFANTAQTKEMLALAQSKGLFVLEAVRSMHNPNTRRLKEALAEIAPVRYAHINHMNYSSKFDAYKRGENPPIFTAQYAGGASYDMGVYNIYTTLELFGKPEQMDFRAYKLESGTDGLGVLTLTDPNKVCVLTASKICSTALPCEISGENGCIHIEHIAELRAATLIKNGQRHEIFEQRLENDLVYECTAFAGVLLDGNRAAYQEYTRQMLEVAEVLEAARKQVGIVFGGE